MEGHRIFRNPTYNLRRYVAGAAYLYFFIWSHRTKKGLLYVKELDKLLKVSGGKAFSSMLCLIFLLLLYTGT